MKTFFKAFLTCGLVLSMGIFTACDNEDDPGPQLTGNSKEYTLKPVSNSAISGTVTFAERDDDQVVITIELMGTQSGSTHPAHIHANSAAAGGGIVLDLEDVDGADGKSETIVSMLNDGTPLTYDDLLDFDGYLNVHLSAGDLGTLIAQGDIGANELTGEHQQYTLNEADDSGVTGTATFDKRKNGTTLVTLALEGTTDGNSHPAHIHTGSVATGGSIAIDLNAVNGATGMSVTNISMKNDQTAITYDQLIGFDGHINVHLSSTELGTLIVQGDIGSNAQ